MKIQIEETPNPRAMKYVLDRPVKTTGKATFKTGFITSLPMIKDLLDLPDVTQVHIYENVISVSQSSDNWESLSDNIRAVIETRIGVHDPNFEEELSSVPISREKLPLEVQKIEEILDRTIRPGLRADGGDVEILKYKDDVLSIRFQGACGGCPSSTMGTLYAIEGILQQEFNPNLQVRPVVSDLG